MKTEKKKKLIISSEYLFSFSSASIFSLFNMLDKNNIPWEC